MRPANSRPPTPRRGLTLIEMLVTVALLLLIMTVVVSIFQSATTAMTAAQTDAELAQATRQFEATLREDLRGATAKLTPPLNPNDQLGYFEYGENALADAQGEDTDDYIALTVQAPEGQPFTGRVVLRKSLPSPSFPQGQFRQVTISSPYAEVLYFQRGTNLYRRVFLIAPNQGGLVVGPRTGGGFNDQPVGTFENYPFDPALEVSWQGMNEISVHPQPPPVSTAPNTYPADSYIPVPNTLGDLTNRENRIFRPRFANDYVNPAEALKNPPSPLSTIPDGKFDDLDLNRVPDFYPTLYPNAVVNRTNDLLNFQNITAYPIARYQHGNIGLLTTSNIYDILPFPFLFPGAYSKADPLDPTEPSPFNPANFGKIHSLVPTAGGYPNHAPLEIGDSLDPPAAGQTWWGFPTWQETLSHFWTSPVKRINDPSGATYYPTNPTPALAQQDRFYHQAPGLSRHEPVALPPIVDPDQPFNDGGIPAKVASSFPAPPAVYQDDVVMTGVRSFDVKAYDPYASVYAATLRPGYYDLGYAFSVVGGGFASATAAQGFLLGFGHEGRIPPLMADYRFDPQWSSLNLGDDPSAPSGGTPLPIVRMRRVWDSWSTDYSNAPDIGLNSSTGLPVGARYTGTGGPIYPSYPAPYPSELRGIQVQIRIVDPRNSRVKVLTIRHDFTDKLRRKKSG